MRTLPLLFTAIAFLSPLFSYAQGTAPAQTIPISHPNVTPPTRAPEKPLPVVAVDGTIVASSTAALDAESGISASASSANLTLFFGVAAGLVLLGGFGWYLLRRRGNF